MMTMMNSDSSRDWTTLPVCHHTTTILFTLKVKVVSCLA